MSAEAGSIRSGPVLAAAPGPAATASGSARFGERQARLGLHQIDELAYAEVFLQFRVLSRFCYRGRSAHGTIISRPRPIFT